MRQIVLDTETTGIEWENGHRLIEIGCVELVNRRLTGKNRHYYLHPDRDIDAGAIEVHGITLDFLADKPRFHEIADEFAHYLAGAELIIHNAPFDLAFLNNELGEVNASHVRLEDAGSIIDTLVDARQRFPGQRNSLDALCKRFEIDNSNRELHGALLDAELLADVYLRMTGGQIDIGLAADGDDESGALAGSDLASYLANYLAKGQRPRVLAPNADEQDAHAAYLEMLAKASGDGCLWQQLDS